MDPNAMDAAAAAAAYWQYPGAMAAMQQQQQQQHPPPQQQYPGYFPHPLGEHQQQQPQHYQPHLQNLDEGGFKQEPGTELLGSGGSSQGGSEPSHTPKPPPPSGYTDITNILDQIMSITGQGVEESDAYKSSLDCHRMRNSLTSVLCELKERIALNNRNMHDHDGQDPQQIRLDTMLIAEGITGPKPHPGPDASGFERPTPPPNVPPGSAANSNVIEHADYKKQLSRIRDFYSEESENFDIAAKDFTRHVDTLLRNQANIRPITRDDMFTVMRNINKKFNKFHFQLKQGTCESVMLLRTKFLDARRKRRNFSKKSSEILNEYFYANLANPYPSEEVKEDLARRCNITVSQVSNWFGNKRIRYKKNCVKSQEEANRYAARAAAAASAAADQAGGGSGEGWGGPPSYPPPQMGGGDGTFTPPAPPPPQF